MTLWAGLLFQLVLLAIGFALLYFVVRAAVISALRHRGIGTPRPPRSAPQTAHDRRTIEDDRRPGA